MMRVENFERWWRNWRAEIGFPDLKFHELRHTQATLLLGNKVDVKTVQTHLGHANPSITLSWYAHAIPENDHEAAAMLGNLFNGQAGNKQRTKARRKPSAGGGNVFQMSFRLPLRRSSIFEF